MTIQKYKEDQNDSVISEQISSQVGSILNVCIFQMLVFTQPLYHREDVTQRKILKWSKAGLNSEFSFP